MPKPRFKIILLITLLLGVVGLNAQENSLELFQKASRFYDSGDFNSAIQSYQQLLDKGIKEAAVYYNLGNAYFKAKKLGKAILYYRKALKSAPRDKDIETNLNFSRLFVLDKMKSSTNLSSVLVDKALKLGTVNEFTFFTFLFYLGSTSLGIAAFFRGEKIIRRGLVICLAIFPILLFFSVIKISRENGWQEAVVTVPTVEIYNGPGQEFTLQFTGHEGLELRIEQEKDDWYLISLPQGAKGWLPKTAVERI